MDNESISFSFLKFSTEKLQQLPLGVLGSVSPLCHLGKHKRINTSDSGGYALEVISF